MKLEKLTEPDGRLHYRLLMRCPCGVEVLAVAMKVDPDAMAQLPRWVIARELLGLRRHMRRLMSEHVAH